MLQNSGTKLIIAKTCPPVPPGHALTDQAIEHRIAKAQSYLIHSATLGYSGNLTKEDQSRHTATGAVDLARMQFDRSKLTGEAEVGRRDGAGTVQNRT